MGKTTKQDSNFFRAFNEIYSIKKIKGQTFNLNHKSVYCFLLNYQMMTGSVFPSYKHIQGSLGIGSDNTVKKYLDELEQMGLVKSTARKGTSKHYELVTLEDFAELETESQQTRKQPNKNLHLKQPEIKESEIVVEPEIRAEEKPEPVTLWAKYKDTLIISNRDRWENLGKGLQQHVMIAVNDSVSDNYVLIKNNFDTAISIAMRSQQPKSENVQVKPAKHAKQPESYDINDLFNCVDHDDNFDKYQKHTHNANKQETVEFDWSDADDEFNFSDDVPF